MGVKAERHHELVAENFQITALAFSVVISAFLVPGEYDFLLHVVVPDLPRMRAVSHGSVAKASWCKGYP